MERLTRPCEDTENGKYIPYVVGKYIGIYPYNENSADTIMGEVVERLAYYENLEEEGLLLRLPCKLGTTLYYVVPDESVTWPDDPEYKIITIAFRPDLIDEFGKKAFLTREEAEIARKEANKMRL